MINVLGADAVLAAQEEEQRLQAEAEDGATGKQDELLAGLTQYVKNRWEKASRAKDAVETSMLNSLRQRQGQYDPVKLAAIKKLGGSQSFIMLTDTKCRSAVAWMKDILFQPGMKPWSIEPTPKPDLPEDLMNMVKAQFMNEAMVASAEMLAMQGLPTDPASVMQNINEYYPDIDKQLEKLYYNTAREVSKKSELHLDDQLIEGGWYTALEQCLDDVATLKAAVLKGPVMRMVKTRERILNHETGAFEVSVVEKVVPTFERRSPFSIYPEPDSVGVDDGYMFDKITLTKKMLYDMIKLPGFNEEAIRRVLEKAESGGLRDWTSLDSEKASIEGKDTSALMDSEKIDCLEFWDNIPGKLLLEWGMEETDIVDPDDSYPSCVWLIGDEVVKAMLNYDQFGSKPFSVTSFEMTEDSFWGRGIPELISDIQGMCNAVVRAIVNNVGIASGPQVEINKQRVAPGFPIGLHPWKVWETTDMGIATAPALKIYNVPMNADKLIQVYNHFQKLADEHSGVPSYAHGDSQVGGAGNTASGLSMLMTHAARGIKSVMRNIDNYLISRSIEKLYFFNMDYMPDSAIIFDMKVVARGSSSLIAKEQQAVRLTEFSQMVNNPVDLQIMGIEGRRQLLLQTARANEIETDKIIPDSGPAMQMASPIVQQAPPMLPAPGSPPPSPANTDAAGNPTQGEDFRTIPQDRVVQ